MTLKQDLETTPNHSRTSITEGNKKPFIIEWSLLKKVLAYKAGSRTCNLCLEKKTKTIPY